MTNRAKSHTLYMFGIYTSINWSITMNLQKILYMIGLCYGWFNYTVVGFIGGGNPSITENL